MLQALFPSPEVCSPELFSCGAWLLCLWFGFGLVFGALFPKLDREAGERHRLRHRHNSYFLRFLPPTLEAGGWLRGCHLSTSPAPVTPQYPPVTQPPPPVSTHHPGTPPNYQQVLGGHQGVGLHRDASCCWGRGGKGESHCGPPPSLFNPISPLFTPIPGTGGGRPVALCSRRASEGVPVVGGSLRGTRWAAGGAGAPFCWGKIKGGNWKGVWGTPKRRVFIWRGCTLSRPYKPGFTFSL